MRFTYDDGGRTKAGYVGYVGDCVTRSISIATRLPYKTVYDAINTLAKLEKYDPISSARNGVISETSNLYLKIMGWKWTSCLGHGKRKVYLLPGHLPKGRLVVSLHEHYTSIINGTIHDTFNPSWDSQKRPRRVWGYWTEPRRHNAR